MDRPCGYKRVRGPVEPRVAKVGPGAIYHVINRGNFKQPVFTTAGAARAFESCLFECCERFAWRLFAFTLMPNHFHLAVQTPKANLAKGMHWLQGTYAMRFNLYRSEHGHVFQGRYRSILLQPGAALARVVNYIHLNPVRCDPPLVSLEQLANFRWSSYRLFVKGAAHPFLHSAEWLADLGIPPGDAKTWRRYHEYLSWIVSDPGEQRRHAYKALCRGWALGDAAWKDAIFREHLSAEFVSTLRGEEDLRELREQVWHRSLEEALAGVGKGTTDVEQDSKSSEWKMAIAWNLRQVHNVPLAWLAIHLNMGSRRTLSQQLSQVRTGKRELRFGSNPHNRQIED